MKKIIPILILCSVLYSCKTVPLTGRRQFSLVPASTMNSLAATSYKETLASSKISTHEEYTAMVQNTGTRIRKAVEDYLASINKSSLIKDFAWEFVLIDDQTVNAWAMPGGRIAFYEGIMPICETEAGVAVVMGHEIAHAIANHSGERMSQSLLTQMGGMSLAVAMKDKPETTQSLALAAFGAGASVGILLPYSRKHEYEADRLGTIFMAMAGYDPNEAPKFWERMRALSGNKSTSDFLSTHPADEKRIAELQKIIPEAMKYYKPFINNNQ
jgi:predicted Zn-dependent protease